VIARTPFRRLFAGLTLAALVAGCASPAGSTGWTPGPTGPTEGPASQAPSASPTATPEPVALDLMLSYIPSVQFFPPLLAEGLGYFDDEGLDVAIQPSEGSSFVVQQVATGNIATGLPAAQSIILGFAQAPDFKVVYQFATRSFGLYVLEDSPIQTVADLAGRSVGTTDLGGGETLSLRIELERAGLGFGTDVDVQVLGYNELGMAEALQQGRVEALSIYWSTSAIANHAGIPVRAISGGSDTSEVGMSLIASSSFIAEHPDVIGRVGRALAKATLFAQTNPEAALEILREVNPEGSVDLDQLRASLDVAIDAIAPANGAPFGANDRAAWASLQEGLLLPGSQSGLSAPVDLDVLIDDSWVDAFNDFDRAAVIAEAEAH
jgi:NitT/TauT family transport system substrate-binding protein